MLRVSIREYIPMAALLSAFDFEGKERISGAMQDVSSEGLENGWDDVRLALSAPSARGYLNDAVIPNLFLSNHDGYRLADHFNQARPLSLSEDDDPKCCSGSLFRSGYALLRRRVCRPQS